MSERALDVWVLILAGLTVVLAARILWFWHLGQLTQPAEWSSAEKRWGRVSAWTFAGATVLSGAVAAYVATRVPWVENLPGLLGRPPVVNGRPTWHQSTLSYLFAVPAGLGAVAAWMTDPRAVQMIRFRGPRDLVLRVLPLMASALAVYSIWSSLAALPAAVR